MTSSGWPIMAMFPSNILLAVHPAANEPASIPSFQQVSFSTNQTIDLFEHEPTCYFVDEGFASIVVNLGSSYSEIGIVGREGILGLPSLLGSKVSPYRVVVRHPIAARRARVVDVRRFMQFDPAFNDLILRYAQAGTAQLIYNLVANAQLGVLSRVARWILMAHDRLETNILAITHARLSEAIGVERSGVTVAIRELERRHAIESRRGSFAITDREILKSLAGEIYGPAEAAYASLIPASP